MIALTKEDPDRAQREEIYTLRRILVRQLQRVTSRASRRERYECHRRFIAEWEQLRDRGEWSVLHAALQGKTAWQEGLSEAPMFLTELAVSARQSEAARRRALAEPRIGLERTPGLDWGVSWQHDRSSAASSQGVLFSLTPVAHSV